MKYNLADVDETRDAFEYLTQLSGRETLVEVKRLSPTRSLKQNNYLHLILSAFGDHFGYDLEEAKIVFKYLNKDIFRYKRKGFIFWKSTASISKEEMTTAIDRFRAASARQGYELPLAIDQGWLRRIENDLERSKYESITNE